jgi:hypothetical protein
MSGSKSAGKVFVISLLLDAAYQVKAFRSFYPVQALMVAMFLAIVPYSLLRGPVNWLTRARSNRVATLSD